MAHAVPRTIGRLLKTQAAVVLLLPCAFALLSFQLAVSVLLGASINFAAQLVFAKIAFRHRGARSAGLIAQSFALGESVKMVLIAVLLAVVLTQMKSIHPLGLFLGLFAVQSVTWFFLFIDRRPSRAAQ